MILKFGKRIAAVLLAVCVLLPVSVYAADSGAGTMTASSRTFIAPGFSYYNRTYGAEGELPQKGVSLELSPESDVYPIVMACDTIWGGMTMDVMVSYAQRLGYNVVGAVNTAFYNSPGVPIGIVVENGVFKSSDDGLNAFAIMEDGTYYIAREPKVRMTLHGQKLGEKGRKVDYLNKLFDESALHIYSSAYSTVSTRVDDKQTVWAVRLLIDEGELRLNGSLQLTVTEVLPEVSAVPIGDEYLVLTASVDGKYGDLWKSFAVGDKLTFETQCADTQLSEAKYVTGCGDILVEDGKIADSTDWMHYIGGVNPRTLVGWRADGTLVMYAAEGRNPGTAEGLTLQMAAEEMLRQGCVYAVNMDGGGSTILGVRLPGHNTIEELNQLSAGAQRQNAAYLLLVTDAQSDGAAQNWHLHQNNLTVLPNQRVLLSGFATDRGLYPSKEQQTLVFADERGLLDGNEYIAPEAGGSHRLSIWGHTGYGEGEIKVISNPSVLKIVDKYGKQPQTVELAVGEKLQLKVVASNGGEAIPADNTVIRYEMSAPIGRVDANNVFIADGLIGTQGTLTMSIGDYSQQIQISLGHSRRDAGANRMKTALDYLSFAP